MTRALSGQQLSRRVNEAFPGKASRFNQTDVWIDTEALLDISRFLYEAPDLDFQFLTSITAVDYIEYIELVYHLLSMRLNHSAILKTRRHTRDGPRVPSVVEVWRGADLQEREVWDLMGVHFEGHPNMKRILLWEEFPGHPLRKDFLG